VGSFRFSKAGRFPYTAAMIDILSTNSGTVSFNSRLIRFKLQIIRMASGHQASRLVLAEIWSLIVMRSKA
jgi:hypothetical protein